MSDAKVIPLRDGVRGEVEVEVCGRSMSIAPTYRAIEAIEARLGCGIPGLLARSIDGDIRVRDFAVVVHEGLKGAGHQGRNGAGEAFTLDQVGEDVLANFARYSYAVGKFLANALGGNARKKE